MQPRRAGCAATERQDRMRAITKLPIAKVNQELM
jgi:hypothetical protein